MSTCVGLSNGMSLPNVEHPEIWSLMGDILNNPVPASNSMLTSPTSVWSAGANPNVSTSMGGTSINPEGDLLWNGASQQFSAGPTIDLSASLLPNLSALHSFPPPEDCRGNAAQLSPSEIVLQKALQAIGSGSTANNLWELLSSSPQAMDILNMSFLNADANGVSTISDPPVPMDTTPQNSPFNFQSINANNVSSSDQWTTLQNSLNDIAALNHLNGSNNLGIPQLPKPKVLLNSPMTCPTTIASGNLLNSSIPNLSIMPSDVLPPPPPTLTTSASGRLGTPSLRSRRGLPDLLTPRVRPSNLQVPGGPDTPSPKLPSNGVRPRDSDSQQVNGINKWDPIKSPRGEAQLSPGVRMSNIPPRSPTGGLSTDMARLGMGSPRGKSVLPPLDVVSVNGIPPREKRMGRNGASTLSRYGSGISNLGSSLESGDCRSPRTPHKVSEDKQSEDSTNNPVLESSGSGKWSTDQTEDAKTSWSSNPLLNMRKGEKGLGLPSPSGVAAVSAARFGDSSEGDDSEAEEDSEQSTSAKDSDGKEIFNSGSAKAGEKNKQSTKPRSVAERLRRERISVRLQKLKEAMPKTDARIDTAAMLEDAVVYIKSLQTRCKVLERQNAALAQQVVVTMAANAAQNQHFRNLQ